MQDAHGNFHKVRALLDTASQANFISTRCCDLLSLPYNSSFTSIQGIGGSSGTNGQGVTTCNIRSCTTPSFAFKLSAIVLTKICSKMPFIAINHTDWSHLDGLQLADPTVTSPGDIDLLLGAEIFPLILLSGKRLGASGLPSAINTVFGWVLMGKVSNSNPHSPIHSFCTISSVSINDLIKGFWEIEQVPSVSILSPDDKKCEELFINSCYREPSGRYCVSLPFKNNKPSFNNSYNIALHRFLLLERRLNNDSNLKRAYIEFMADYLQSGHMELSSKISVANQHQRYYIPHHAVFHSDETKSKFRVVFDASAKDADGVSLNSTLLTGPKLQLDISRLLLNFRLHNIVLCADKRQMYRQILINPSHREYQHILWRASPKDEIQDFVLNTVTYGVASAPFLALRVMNQLAIDEASNFPLASNVLQTSRYIDDILAGCKSLDEASELLQQLIGLCASAGMELRKWSSNNPSLLAGIPKEHCQTILPLDKESENVIKVLGLEWNPAFDVFSFRVKLMNRPCTKRNILSDLARIFDPLGFLAPLTFFAKHFMQLLWSLGLDWDAQPPQIHLDRWIQFTSELPIISKLRIPRHLFDTNSHTCEIHGFCDASEKGYAAVVYFRLIATSNIHIRFVAAKSKVAPLKRLSIPRLELCAAQLLAKLISLILESFPSVTFQGIFAWSDSTVALTWIKSLPHRWKTFVSNRVSYIQDKLPPSSWRHIRSEENPADCASRGLLPAKLVDFSLWWAGPCWLKNPVESWPVQKIIQVSENCVSEEERTFTFVNFVETDSNFFYELLRKFSSFSKITRIIAYILRFRNNIVSPNSKKRGHLTSEELSSSKLLLIKTFQNSIFSAEISCIKNDKRLSKSFRKLYPFIDKEGLLRVGGRLTHSRLNYDQKFPLLLPCKHRITDLIIEETHRRYLHPGLNALQYLLNQQYWILSSKRAIRRVISKCIACFKVRPVTINPLMGNLPTVRVNEVKPFLNVGIDFGGPFLIKSSHLRNCKSIKSYVCVFVCMATKAIHIELISDLSSDSFLAGLRRFVARRGHCTHIFSDCGTNFVGAYRQLLSYMQTAALSDSIKWSFHPPSAPNFGGLWEAGIKSIKTHLKRVIGEQVLTFEELYTLLVQIEAVLNSRPLTPLSSDPSDFSVLTPGHFLTLAPLTAVPDTDLTSCPINRLKRWQLLQRLHQDFWRRWKHEYLHTLQQRSKWTDKNSTIQPGTLVLLKNDLTPPLQWKLGRVLRVHPGSDGIPRVATITTAQGNFKRPVNKLCPLPMSTV